MRHRIISLKDTSKHVTEDVLMHFYCSIMPLEEAKISCWAHASTLMALQSSSRTAAESNLPNDFIKNVSEIDRTLNQLDSQQPNNYYFKSNGSESKRLQLIAAQ